jgi:hypothetical protein
MAAGDNDTMTRTVNEWQLRASQGYPKEVPPLRIEVEDFEDITAPD